MRISDRHVPMNEAGLALSQALHALMEQYDLTPLEWCWLLQAMQNELLPALLIDEENRLRLKRLKAQKIGK